MLVLGPALAALPTRRLAWLTSPLAIGAVLLFVGVARRRSSGSIPRITGDGRTPAALFEAYVPWAMPRHRG